MKDFLKDMFSSEGNVSSKRVAGLLCMLVFIIIVLLSYFKNKELANSVETLVLTCAYIGTALLGMGLGDRFRKL